MFKRAVCLLLAGCCLHSSVRAACGNIVALSADGQYMVLEADTLRTLEVGSLWWLGIFNASVNIDGSSYGYAMISTDHFVDLATDRYMMNGMEAQELFRHEYGRHDAPYGWVALENMGTDARTQRDLDFVERTNWGGYHEARISPHFSPGAAIWEIRSPDRSSVLQLVDRNLQVIQTWEDPVLVAGLSMGFCRDGNLLYLLGGERDPIRQMRIVLNGGDMSALPLRSWDEERYAVYRIDPHSCTVMAVKRVEDDETLIDEVYFDFRDERIISAGERYRYADVFLFNYGANVLRRYLEPTGSIQPSIQTDRFLVVDTESLSIVEDELLDAEGAYLSRELICEPETPKAVLYGRGKFGLVDLNDLEIIAWKTLPWETFTVFE